MRIAKPPSRAIGAAAALAVVAVVGGVALTSGGANDPDLTGSPDPSPALTTSSPTHTGSHSPAESLPSVPPGGAPSAPEETAAEVPADEPRPAVPPGALLDADTVAAVVGGRWQKTPAPPDSCDTPRPAGAVASRSGGLAGPRGVLLETVATHAADGEVRAVDALAQRLRTCGWTLAEEPPLGEDSAALTKGDPNGRQHLVIVGADGVTVTMVGRGRVADDADDWAALVDVAIGTSCLAASDGCH